MHKWTFCSYIALVLTVKTTSMTFNHLKNNLILPASVALVFMQPGLKAQDKKEIGEKTEKRGPNIVYVFPDQYRKQAMGFWGEKPFKGALNTKPDPVYTPNLNYFARQSLVFTSAVSNTPVSSAHRGSLFTGFYPSRSGVPLNCNATRPISSLPQEIVCYTDILKQQGYQTGYIGKWHLDYPTPNNPEKPGTYVEERWPAWDAYTPAEKRHGFDYWYSYGTRDIHKDPRYFDSNGQAHRPGVFSAQHDADKAIEFIKQKATGNNGQPFALFVAMNPPHHPYGSLEDCMEEDLNLYKQKEINELLVRENADTKLSKAASAPYYFANITAIDREFGRILDALKETGLDENTIVVFTSDHGETMCSHGLEDAKNTIYSEAYDVPFIIRWPQKLKPDLSKAMLSTPDILPTILGLAGLEAELPNNRHGFNYAKTMTGQSKKLPRSALYIKNVDGKKDANGLVTNYFPVARGVKTDRYTLSLSITKDKKIQKVLFFDHKKDPYELNNLAFDPSSKIAKDLLKELAFWLKHSEDPWFEEKILENIIPY